MPYPDLPPSEPFWRCPRCGNEKKFRASGVGHVECPECGQMWTVEQLKAARAATTPASSPTSPRPPSL